MLTPEDIAAIRERAERATAGPWHLYRDGVDEYQNGGLVGPDGDLWGGYDSNMPDDATIDFIACARTDIPALLAHVEELEAKPSTERRFWKDGDKLYVEQYVRIGDCSDLNDPKRTEGELRAKLNEAMDNTISLLP